MVYNRPMKTLSKDEIKVDIQILRKRLEEIHPNPYKYISKASFDSLLEKAIETSKDIKDLGLSLMSILPRLKDGHTYLGLSDEVLGTENFMFKFHYFDKGYFLTESSEELSHYLGSELLSINKIPIKEIEKRVSIFIPQENETSIKYYLSSKIVEPHILEFVGIKTNDKIQLALNHRGKEESVAISPQDYSNKTLYLRDSLPNLEDTLIQKDTYWFKILPDLNAFYFQYNECKSNENLSIEKVTSEFKNSELKTFILDLRNNKGGDSDILKPLINYLKKHDRKYRKIVLTGSDTYSSAIINLLQFSSIPNTTSIGEIPHGNPTHYGEQESFSLPNSKLKICTSSKIFKFKGYKLGESFKPNYIINTDIKKLSKGIDTQIEFLHTIFKK